MSEFDRSIKIETETCHHLKRVIELNEISDNEFIREIVPSSYVDGH